MNRPKRKQCPLFTIFRSTLYCSSGRLRLRSRCVRGGWISGTRARFPIGLRYLVCFWESAVHSVFAGWHGLVASLEGAGLALAVLLPLVLLRGLGAGDWKLMGAVGAFPGAMGHAGGPICECSRIGSDGGYNHDAGRAGGSHVAQYRLAHPWFFCFWVAWSSSDHHR